MNVTSWRLKKRQTELTATLSFFSAAKRAFDALLAGVGDKGACRTMVALLALAHDRACEAELAEALLADLDAGQLPDLDRLRERFRPPATAVPEITIEMPSLDSYDELASVTVVPTAIGGEPATTSCMEALA